LELKYLFNEQNDLNTQIKQSVWFYNGYQLIIIIFSLSISLC